MLKRHTTQTICIVFIFLTIVYYYLFSSGYFPLSNKKTVNHSLDAFASQSTSEQYNDKGMMTQALSAKHADHFKSPPSTTLNKPHITLPSKDQTVWTINAKYGKSFDGGEKIILWDNVVLHRPALQQYAETTITTQHLVYYKTKKLAFSNTLTHVTQPGNTATGNDVSINLKNDIIHIKNQARGKFKPINSNQD